MAHCSWWQAQRITRNDAASLPADMANSLSIPVSLKLNVEFNARQLFIMQQYRRINTIQWQRTASVLPRLTAPALPARHSLAHKKHFRQQKLQEELPQWRLRAAPLAAGSAGILESQPEVASSASAAPQQFNWDKQWYPLAQVDDLDPATPGHFRLLGRDLVVWFDRAENSWRAFADRCPHRLAPLSEGRIDQEGHLYCNYHGVCP